MVDNITRQYAFDVIHSYNPAVPPSEGDPFGAGFDVGEVGGVTESELPTYWSSDLDFMRGFQAGVTARHVSEIADATELSPGDIYDGLVLGLEATPPEILAKMAAAIRSEINTN